jgi:hypothetical protein
MLVYFIAIWCTYGRAIWYILFISIWYFLGHFGMLYQERSGNLVGECSPSVIDLKPGLRFLLWQVGAGLVNSNPTSLCTSARGDFNEDSRGQRPIFQNFWKKKKKPHSQWIIKEEFPWIQVFMYLHHWLSSWLFDLNWHSTPREVPWMHVPR